MKGATRTATVRMTKPSGKSSNRSQKYPILVLAAHKSKKLINSQRTTSTRE